MTEPLTKRQQELIEINHNLIYKFAHYYNLSIEEYYDILAIGMCKAASTFDESKGAFTTVAFRCMRNEMFHYWDSMKKKSAIPNENLLYYDTFLHGKSGGHFENDNNSYLSIFSDNNYTHDTAIGNIIINEFMKTLKKEEIYLVKLLMIGITQAEIAEKTNRSRQLINLYVRNIRKKLNAYLRK